ncbi:MAG: galactose mutarotase [Lachnospiraceae bacterium]|nr:galactose mutarotase [Lachnospiraceae bacterium]
METLEFGTNQRGEKASLYVLENKKHTVIKVSDHGATLVSVLIPDKDGVVRDVVLGYDEAAEYDSHTCYFGATIGRNGNRIDKAQMTIDGKLCQVPANENENNLHSGPNGFDRVVWEVKERTENSITFFHLSTEEEQGFPGNLKTEVTYTLTDEDAVEISYRGEADKTTIMNFTNHSYFNLGGHDSGSAMDQKLQILAEAYHPVRDSKSIPTGEIAPVEGTPMDFRTMKPIGQDIEADFEQLKFTGGYDHNYVLSDKVGEMKVMANAYCEKTGIAMEASTDCCGVQLYAGNFIGDQTGKGGAAYCKRCGFCLESQFYPNAMNQENVPSPVVKAGDVFTTKTIYRFYVK